MHDTRSDPHLFIRISYGAKLPVTLTVRERDLIQDETFCDPDLAKCAVVEGIGIRAELSLGELRMFRADATKNSKRRKELDRLFDKPQIVLDEYDDQSE